MNVAAKTNSNTTLVKVKSPEQNLYVDQKNGFKYNTC